MRLEAVIQWWRKWLSRVADAKPATPLERDLAETQQMLSAWQAQRAKGNSAAEKEIIRLQGRLLSLQRQENQRTRRI